MTRLLLGTVLCVMVATGAFTESINGNEGHVDDKKIAHSGIIFPGTKWCGVGNIASNPSDLGVYRETDSCCRDHDGCSLIIHAGQTRYNLTNQYLNSRLSCDCDETFLRCLTNVGSLSSYTVRKIYFSVQTQCFKFAYPIVMCNRYYPNSKRCQSYSLNETAPKRFQWFDLPLS